MRSPGIKSARIKVEPPGTQYPNFRSLNARATSENPRATTEKSRAIPEEMIPWILTHTRDTAIEWSMLQESIDDT